jgi:hypothetical protein
MSRPRNAIPSYRLHKQSGQAIVTLTDGLGGRHDVLLGKYGTPASRQEYARVIAEWESSHRFVSTTLACTDLTINELILRFWAWATQHYRRPDGSATNELKDFQLSLNPLIALYGHILAKEYGPMALKAVRQAMMIYDMALNEQTQKLARKYGISPARVSQLRREDCEDWKQFRGEDARGVAV